MAHRQLADQDGHRWDVEDEGPIARESRDGRDGAEHRLRFTRDDGIERVRTAPRGVDQLADVELRALLGGEDASVVERGPDTEANESRGYGDAAD